MISHINDRLNQWAQWKLQRQDGGSVVCATYLMMARGNDPDDAPPPASRVPIDDIECCDTDRCVVAINGVLQKTVTEFYLRTATPIEQKAHVCGCSVKTLYRRIDEAHRQIMAYLNDLSCGVAVKPWRQPELLTVDTVTQKQYICATMV